MDALNTLADVLMLMVVAPMVGYLWRYWRGSDWRSTAAGRAAFWQSLSTLLLMGVAIISVYGGLDAEARPFLRAPIYALLLCTSMKAYFTLAAYQRFSRGRAQDPDRRLAEPKAP